MKYLSFLFLLHNHLFTNLHAFSATNNNSVINNSPKLQDNEIGHTNNDYDNGGFNDENTSVQVMVKRNYPTLSSPKEARDAWLSYVWEKGGGLPAFVIPKKDDDSKKGSGINVGGSRNKVSSSRLLLPLFMKEELILNYFDDNVDADENENENEIVMRYIVTDAGLLSSEIVPSTHLGTLIFASCLEGNQGIDMTWDVTYDITEASRQSFWQAFTDQMITDASDNLSSYLATPNLYTRKTRLVNKPNSNPLTPKQAMDEFMEFCWKDGGGLPLPPPLFFGGGRWIIPPFLKERIVSSTCTASDDSDSVHGQEECCEIKYTVDNPGIATYQVHTHLGRIRFLPVSSNNSESDKNTLSSSSMAGVDMIWEIEIRPYHNWSTFVKSFTSIIVATYARNFKCHLYEGSDAMVALKPPRGAFGGEPFMQIRKDSWIGGILDAHLNDRRSTVEQTKSLFQPWTWGRLDDESGEGAEWTEGHLS